MVQSLHARCKWTFSHNLNFLRKKPFIFIKNYTFYFGKYITTYYLLMCRILQFPICVATETPLRIVVVGLPESIFQTRSRFSNFIPEPSSFNDSVALYSTPGSGSVACEVYNRQPTDLFFLRSRTFDHPDLTFFRFTLHLCSPFSPVVPAMQFL